MHALSKAERHNWEEAGKKKSRMKGLGEGVRPARKGSGTTTVGKTILKRQETKELITV